MTKAEPVTPPRAAALSRFDGDGSRDEKLIRVLDALREGLLLFNRSGREVHRNTAVEEILRTDPEHPRIREELEVLKRSLGLLLRNRREAGAGAPNIDLSREVRTGSAVYRLRGLHLGDGEREEEPSLLVVLERFVPRPLSDGELRHRFRLTGREIEVTRLISGGMATGEIAEALSLSRHTVRRHVERVLLKVGAHSRVELGLLVVRGERRG